MRTSAAAIRCMPLSVLNSKIRKCDVLLSRTSAVSHDINIPRYCRTMIMAAGSGGSRFWIGFATLFTDNGTPSVTEIAKGSNTTQTASAGKVTITFNQADTCLIRAVSINSNEDTIIS